MRRFATIALFAFVLLAAPAIASDGIPVDEMEAAAPIVRVVSQEGGELRLLFELPELTTTNLAVGPREFQAVEFPGCGFLGAPGEPAIPVFSKFIAVPEGATVRVRTVRLEEEVREGVLLLPAQRVTEGAEAEFEYDEEAYARGGADDGVDATVGEPEILRDLRVAPLTFQPIRYDPASRTLRIARRLEVEVAIVGAAPEKAAVSSKPIPPSFDAIYEALVVNYDAVRASSKVAPGTILVVAPNTAAVLDTISDWLEWRERKGWPVDLHTVAPGTAASTIKAYIQSVYNDPTKSLEYVIIVGDVDNIPTYYESMSGYGGEGDLPYAQLAGSDILADVHIGRLSYSTMNELTIIVRKIVGYEANPYVTDTTWFRRGFVVGDPTSSGPSCVETGRWVRNLAFEEGYAEVDTAFSATFVTKMQTALNRGDTFFGYRGYYQMSGWSNGYTAVLTNGWRLPFCVILTCDTGSFAGGTSRAEGFLRAGTLATNPPSITMRGGIGAIGMATIGTHTGYNNSLYYGTWHGFFREGLHTMGAAQSRGKLEMYLNYYGTVPNTVHWFTHWNNLMGDPTVDIYTGIPATLTVDYPATVPIGANSILVSVTESGGAAVEQALVCVWKGSETYEVGYTDDNGSIELSLSNATAGSMMLTVTKHNKRAHLGTVTVANEAYVGLASTLLDDDASGGSVGNSDGAANPLETIEIDAQLRNFGATQVQGVSATLTSEDLFVTISDATEDYGTIAAGGTAWNFEDFDVQVHADCPDGHSVRFSLDAVSALKDRETWHSILDLEIVSAAFTPQSWTFYNDGGNGPDPGETVQLAVSIKNEGGANATGVTGNLVSLSPQVTVTDASGAYAPIAIGATGSNGADRFTISVQTGTYEGYLANFELIMTFNGGAIDTVPFGFAIGQRSSVDPVGPDAYGYLAYENVDAAYPEAPAYSWIELDPAYGGSGATELSLPDYGDGQDQFQVVNMPFGFRYYDQNYTQATVSSNGWVSMGPSNSKSYRNWTIPGAGGPDAMIAAFWDDLYKDAGSKILHKYDAANHVWIVEWSRVRNVYSGSIETFEAILYDPAFHATDTGDGIIVLQYQTVANNDAGDNYATVGIENHDQTDGVLVTAFARYAAGATGLAAGRAIKFLPTRDTPTGTLQGTLYNASNGNSPASGVLVTVLGSGRSFSSGEDGAYGGSVPPGTYSVVASHPSFEPDTVTGVVILEAQATVRDFYLTDIAGPAIATTEHPSTDDVDGPYVIPVTVTDYSGIEELTLYWRTNWDATPHGVSLTPVAGNDYTAEIPGQPFVSVVQYWVYARDTGDRESFDPPTAPPVAFQFNVAPIDTMLDDEFEAVLGWTIGAGDDNATSGIWVQAEPVGSEYNGYTVQPDSDYTAPPGTICFVTGNAGAGEAAGTNDVDGGKTTILSPVFDLSGFTSASLSYAVWYTNDRGSNPNGDTWLVQATNNGSSWVDLENTTASTNAWVTRSFSLESVFALTGSVRVRFVASDNSSGSLVEAAVDDFLLTATSDVATGVADGSLPEPARFGLDPCRPNPFNPETSISFHMAAAGRAELRIYDVSGRLVKTLVEGTESAGSHEVRWDGSTDAGRSASSGIYFIRLEAPGFLQVRQMTLVR